MEIIKAVNENRLTVKINKDENLIKGFNFEYLGYDKKSRTQNNYSKYPEQFTIHIVLSGKGTCIIDNKTYYIKKDDYFFFKPDNLVTYYPDVKDPWEYIWILFSGDEVQKIINELNFDKTPLGTLISTDNVANIIADIKAIVNEQNTIPLYRLNISLLEILYEILYNRIDYVPQKAAFNPPIITGALNYISINYPYKISITELSKHLGVCGTSLFRLFKKYFGVSPQRYIINYRLNTAYHQISESPKTLQEISDSCGFSNYSHFSKMFTDYFHCTPIELRNKKYNYE